jgi:cation diffusion facilitator family transporter
MLPEEQSQKSRIQVAVSSIVAGSLILGLKYLAFQVSGSTALKSDAIESVVNVVAAVFALGAIIFAGKPADREHPYGHGKIEHFSAAFEGGMISLAAVLIWYEALKSLIQGVSLDNLGKGLWINFLGGALNGLLGLFLVRVGRRQRSQALVADGKHVLSDFYTTLGLGAGLLLVRFTGLTWLDPVMALLVGTLLAWTGFHLVKTSSAALLDTEDTSLVEHLVETINRVRPADLLAIHELRTLRSGRYAHVDIHLVIPEFYGIGQGHDLADRFAKTVLAEGGLEGELHTHVDPCQRAHCRYCPVERCPVRQEPHTADRPITLDKAVEAGAI